MVLKIIKRMLGNNKKACDSKLNLAIWANRIITENSIGFAPYELVYGKQARLPLNNLLLVYNFVTQEQLEDINFMNDRLTQLAELDEIRRKAQKQNIKKYQQIKLLHDKKEQSRNLKEGEWVLKWNAKD
ncbi:uncharacterized protein LOC131030381 [Cryptomeria japonica]|uniref:uncharacterized protein LOC131030381 n=1 Tax=Cryptomeria japonica TaxID=3369 RepID=UPI0025ACED57|nr:uncharacterized protein LOC131030381 [Cryptomeria japonica]